MVKGPDKAVNTQATRFVTPPSESTPGSSGKARPQSSSAHYSRLWCAVCVLRPTGGARVRSRRGKGWRQRGQSWRERLRAFRT